MTDDEIRITRRYMPALLRRYRAKTDLSTRDVAERVGISKGFYGNMEAGTKWPNIDMLIRIAHALNADPGEMLNAMIAEWKKDGGSLY